MSPLLEVRDLTIRFPTAAGTATPVSRVSLTLDRGETLALVGESGSGKSLTGLSLLGLVPPAGRVAEESRILFDGTDLTRLDPRAMRAIRGGRIGIVFQDPMTSLTPVLTVGDQLREAIQAHRPLSRVEARREAVGLLAEAGIPDAPARFDAYPHELSGGLRQRALIAIALAGKPDLLIADEPTTALDVTVQAQILELLARLQQARGMAVLLITHDLGVVAGMARRVAVMYAGQIVEEAPAERLFHAPAHPYTRALLRVVPRLDRPAARFEPIPGSVPRPTEWWPGCRFEPRCPEAMPRCRTEEPVTLSGGPDQPVKCWLWDPRR